MAAPQFSTDYVKITAVSVAIGISTWLLYRHNCSKKHRALLKRAAAKVDERNKKKWQVLETPLSADEEAICMLAAEELQRRMASKKLTCEAVTTAFCRKARRDCFVDGLNAITEECYDEAVATAQKLDHTVTPEMWKDARYPLLGLPISVKDTFTQKGTDSTFGMARFCYCDGPSGAPEDGFILRLVREAGGIPFVRTNMPQLGMSADCGNNIWGRTKNPYNPSRTCGGSSGGEAALIGSQCSVIGLGSDIGGSSRIPALCCGIYGFLPTNNRMSHLGSRQARPLASIVIRPVLGPLSSDVDGCAKVMKVMYSDACYEKDPNVPHMPWREPIYRMGTADGKGKKRLRIAYFTTNEYFQPCSAALRALHEAKSALTTRGHELIQLPIPPQLSGWEAARLYVGIMGAYGNFRDFVDELDGERLYPDFDEPYRLSNTPNWIRSLLKPILLMMGEERKVSILSVLKSGGISVRKERALCRDLQMFRKRWLEAIEPFDCILFPGLPLPATRQGKSMELTIALTYLFFVNLLEWPCGACPVIRVRDDEETYPIDALPTSQQDSWARIAAKEMPDTRRLPMGVQIMARPFCDELCLFAMKELEEALDQMA